MSKITIVDLEVFYCVGVTDEERAKPQRLLLTVDMSLDFSSASVSDRIERTINYQRLVDELLKFGEGRSWKLLEKLVAKIAERTSKVQAAEKEEAHGGLKKTAAPEATNPPIAYVYLIDKKTGVVVRMETIGADGESINEQKYDSFRIAADLKDDLFQRPEETSKSGAARKPPAAAAQP